MYKNPTHEIEEIMIGDDLYNVQIGIDVDIDGGIEVESVERCYKHLKYLELQRCEPLHKMAELVEDFIKSDHDTYERIISEYKEWN